MVYNIIPQSVEILFSIIEVVNQRNIIHHGQVLESSNGTDVRVERISVPVESAACVISFTGKTENDTLVKNGTIIKDSMIRVDAVWVNNILIERWALENFCKFYPEYSESNKIYSKQNNIDLPEYTTGQLDFFYNGKLVIELDNFFPRYHACLTKSLEQFNHWVLNSHLGHVEKSKKEELCDILNSL